MITKQDLIDYLGGTYQNVAKNLGYVGKRGDNNISRLPEVLTDKQAGVIKMRMKANRIKIPKHW